VNIDKALIVRPPFAGLIVDGHKKWEMRSKETIMRGRIGIIEGGTGLIIGEVDIVDCLSFPNHSDLYAKVHMHQVEDFWLLDKWKIAWVLDNHERYDKPIKYEHPKGAVTWVRV
jgi:predicted transcriptional regulator